MTKEKETYNRETYGTEYPMCGNCKHIREIAGQLMCEKYREFRCFNSVKCTEYKYTQHIPKWDFENKK